MFYICINKYTCTNNSQFFLKGNGLDERFNQTLQNMLMKFVSENKNEWDAYLDTSIYAYNTFIHKSTSFLPFEVMFGRKAIMPIDMEMSTTISAIDNEVSSTDIEMLAKQRQKNYQHDKRDYFRSSLNLIVLQLR